MLQGSKSRIICFHIRTTKKNINIINVSVKHHQLFKFWLQFYFLSSAQNSPRWGRVKFLGKLSLSFFRLSSVFPKSFMQTPHIFFYHCLLACLIFWEAGLEAGKSLWRARHCAWLRGRHSSRRWGALVLAARVQRPLNPLPSGRPVWPIRQTHVSQKV